MYSNSCIILGIQVVARTAVPPGDGGLRQGGHPAAPGNEHPALPAGQQVLPGGNGLPAAGHRLHGQHAHHRAQRLACLSRRRAGRRGEQDY